MVNLTITASIPLKKMIEFNQTKMDFLHHLQKMEGYTGFTEKLGVVDYKLIIEWRDLKCLKKFRNSITYFFFHGALVTLGTVKKIEIKAN